MKRLNLSLIRDHGAALMMEIILKRVGIGLDRQEWFWTDYYKRLRAHREAAIQHQMKLVRFSLLHRAGRDLDWIRSYRKHGVPPVPDDD